MWIHTSGLVPTHTHTTRDITPLARSLWLSNPHNFVQPDHHLGKRQHMKTREKTTIPRQPSSHTGRRLLQRRCQPLPTPAGGGLLLGIARVATLHSLRFRKNHHRHGLAWYSAPTKLNDPKSTVDEVWQYVREWPVLGIPLVLRSITPPFRSHV